MFFDCLPDEVVDAQVVAWRARDAAAYAAVFAPDAVVVMGEGEDDTLRGRDAIRDFYENAFIERVANLEMVVTNRIISGNYVIDERAMSGDSVAGEIVGIYEVRGCEIVRQTFLPWVEHEEGVAE